MAFEYTNKKGVKYYLHTKKIMLRGNREQQIYYFCRDVRNEAIDKVPDGYKVKETERTGMPVLKKV